MLGLKVVFVPTNPKNSPPERVEHLTQDYQSTLLTNELSWFYNLLLSE
jgi:hypothetical protein